MTIPLLLIAGCLAGPVPALDPLRAPPSNDATPVAVGFYVVNLGKINQTDETFDIAGLVTMTWRDPRLAFDPGQTGERLKRFSPDQIWVPELTIVNAANLQRRSLIHLSGQPDGSVKWVEFVTVTVSSDFNLRLFPFDAQTALVIWEPLSAEVQPLTLSIDARANGVSTDSYVGLSEWQIGDVATDLGERETAGVHFPRLTYRMQIRRNYGFYLLKVALPLVLISVISWTVFWINPNTAFASQLSLGITSILAAITFNITTTNSLPRVPYTTLMDIYIATCYLFFFATILTVVYNHFLITREETKRAETLMRRSRWIFPSLFLMAQALGMGVFLTI